MIPEAVYAQEASKARLEGVDEGRQHKRLCLTVPSICWQGDIDRDRTGSKGGERSHKRPCAQTSPHLL